MKLYTDVAQGSQDWHELRKGKIAASMIGAIYDAAPYLTRSDAIRAMVRASFDAETEFKGNPATEWDNANEAGARAEFSMETGFSVETCGFYADEIDGMAIGASPDGLIGDDKIIEIKCPYGLRKSDNPEFKSINSDDLYHYYLQVQFQLLLTKRKYAYFYQWAPKGTKIEVVQFNEHAIDMEKLREFWDDYLLEMQSPDIHLAPKIKEIDTPLAAKLVSEYDDLKTAIELAEERKKDIIAQLAEITNGQNSKIAGRNFTLVKKEGAVSYVKAIKALVPDFDPTPWCGSPIEYWLLK